MTRDERRVAADAMRWREMEGAAHDWRNWAQAALAVAGMFALMRLAAWLVIAAM